MMHISSLSDEKMARAYNKWFAADSDNWRSGLAMLCEMSRRFGMKLEEKFYVDGVKRLATIKPSFQHREHIFFPDTFVLSLDKIKETINEVTSHGVFGMVEGSAVASLSSKTMRYQVPQIHTEDDFATFVNGLLGDKKGLLGAMEGRKLITFGSCFAVNIGRVLKERGFDVYSMLVAEDINSTFNNLLLLKRVFLGEKSAVSEEILKVPGMDYDVLRREFESATDIVFTLGNIFHLEGENGPTVNATETASLKAESIAETLAYLEKIFLILEEHTKGKILVSVSPVPISGYRGNEFKSAMEADCVSKSQLRAVLQACLRKHPGITYIPTFEIFRWMPAHQSFATFGVDDGNCRHLSRSHVARVMDAIT